MSNTILNFSNLWCNNFTEANLGGTNLGGTDLGGTDLIDAATDIPNFLTEEYLTQNNIQGAEYLLQTYSLVEIEFESPVQKPHYKFILK